MAGQSTWIRPLFCSEMCAYWLHLCNLSCTLWRLGPIYRFVHTLKGWQHQLHVLIQIVFTCVTTYTGLRLQDKRGQVSVHLSMIWSAFLAFHIMPPRIILGVLSKRSWNGLLLYWLTTLLEYLDTPWGVSDLYFFTGYAGVNAKNCSQINYHRSYQWLRKLKLLSTALTILDNTGHINTTNHSINTKTNAYQRK